ncbi:hypothetical protein FYK55_06140 [Roseiconus nitratireducens]|uniref:Uncharacterized protein n=1 Tax=Roseiconus nitratireducens TaxID=2605748 RepID=A0A5M6DCF4_9BACT|nr:hypothetical protein [Roseiconus nitratireducens]KAA5545241.1 hypothetical protein FYK55_06140 [Roseiconus nitratireducens]
MNENRDEQMTCQCPNGHKLRGNVELIGKTIRCPRCSETFVFGYQVRPSVTDTAVMRILGDGPGAMGPAQEETPQPRLRPCKRCGVSISATVSVCKHCNCYVGMLPDYLAQMHPPSNAAAS